MRISIALLALTLAACAASPDKLPPYGADKPLPVPEIVQHTLANGLTVWIVPRDGLPRVDLVLVVRGGLAADPANAPARSELLAALLREGTTTRSAQQLAEELQGIGGSLAAAAGTDSIRINAQALVSGTPKLFELLADVTRNAAFPTREVTLAKANALQALKASETDPSFVASRAFDRTIFGTHPYGNTKPTAAAIRSTTRRWLRAEHARRFRPDRALLVVVGRINAGEAVALAQSTFGSWRSTSAAPSDTAAAPRSAPPQRVLVDRAGSVQSTLVLGRPAIAGTDPDLIPLTLTNAILGGSFTSRMMRSLREEKGYTYGAYTSLQDGRAGGAIVGSADVRNEVTGAALTEYFRLCEALGQTPPDEDELQRAKRYAAGVYLYRNQQQGALARTLANNWVKGLPAEHLATYVPRIQAVTAEQVQAMARKYFAPADQTLIIVGDESAIAGQLEPFGTFQPFGL